MKKLNITIILLLFSTQFLLANNDGRAIRSNWFCMDAFLGCVGIYDHGSPTEGLVNFSVTLRFKPFEYNDFPDPYIQLEAGNTSVVLPIVPNSIADVNNHSQQITHYDSKDKPVYETVADITISFSALVSMNATDFDYTLLLVTYDKEPYPVDVYDRMMAPFDPQPNWSSYAINNNDQIKEAGNKPICDPAPCSGTLPRLNVDEQETVHQSLGLQVTPNPFSNQLIIQSQLQENTDQLFIEILDITGRTVYHKTEHNLTAGNHQFSINSDHWPLGIYSCKVQTQDEIKVVKVLKN